MQQISESNLYYNITAAFYGRKGPETINLNKKCNKRLPFIGRKGPETINLNKKCNKQPPFMDVKDPKPKI